MAPYTAMVKVVPVQLSENQAYDTEKDATITLKGNGYGNSILQAKENAERNIFETLLFKGVPGTQNIRPMIPNEQEAKIRNPEFFETFFSKREYGPFITSMKQTGSTKIRRGSWENVQELTINLRSLKTHLEQNRIIRKFGI